MTKNEYFKEISEKLKGMVGKTISSIGAHESLSLLEIVFSDKSLLRIEGWDYENQSNSEILISVANDERVHHYQRGRASITGWRLKLG